MGLKEYFGIAALSIAAYLAVKILKNDATSPTPAAAAFPYPGEAPTYAGSPEYFAAHPEVTLFRAGTLPSAPLGVSSPAQTTARRSTSSGSSSIVKQNTLTALNLPNTLYNYALPFRGAQQQNLLNQASSSKAIPSVLRIKQPEPKASPSQAARDRLRAATGIKW